MSKYEVEKVTLEDFEKELERAEQAPEKPSGRISVREEIRRLQQYDGELHYVQRGEDWHIILVDWGEEIGTWFGLKGARKYAKIIWGRER